MKNNPVLDVNPLTNPSEHERATIEQTISTVYSPRNRAPPGVDELDETQMNQLFGAGGSINDENNAIDSEVKWPERDFKVDLKSGKVEALIEGDHEARRNLLEVDPDHLAMPGQLLPTPNHQSEKPQDDLLDIDRALDQRYMSAKEQAALEKKKREEDKKAEILRRLNKMKEMKRRAQREQEVADDVLQEWL